MKTKEEIEEIIKKKKDAAALVVSKRAEKLKERKEYIKLSYERQLRLRQDPLFDMFTEAKYALSIYLSDNVVDKMWYDLHPAWYKSKEPRYRYYIFPISIGKYMQARSSCQAYEVRKYKACNKRKKIGNILNNFHRKIIVVYYATSKCFRFYFNVGSMCVRVDQDRLKVFDTFPLVDLLKGGK